LVRAADGSGVVPDGGKGPWKFHKATVALWILLGTLIVITSALAVSAGGIEALYLVVTGWIVGPFFFYWVYKKARAAVRR